MFDVIDPSLPRRVDNRDYPPPPRPAFPIPSVDQTRMLRTFFQTRKKRLSLPVSWCIRLVCITSALQSVEWPAGLRLRSPASFWAEPHRSHEDAIGDLLQTAYYTRSNYLLRAQPDLPRLKKYSSILYDSISGSSLIATHQLQPCI